MFSIIISTVCQWKWKEALIKIWLDPVEKEALIVRSQVSTRTAIGRNLVKVTLIIIKTFFSSKSLSFLLIQVLLVSAFSFSFTVHLLLDCAPHV